MIDILSTWGDRHYVGLTGIQVFSSTGEAVNIAKVNITDYINNKCVPKGSCELLSSLCVCHALVNFNNSIFRNHWAS